MATPTATPVDEADLTEMVRWEPCRSGAEPRPIPLGGLGGWAHNVVNSLVDGFATKIP